MDDVLTGAADPATRALAKVITHVQLGEVKVLEEEKEGPVQDGSFWGIRWKGGRKMAPAVVPQEIQQLHIPRY